MVLRHLYIEHDNKKRQQEADARELVPYQEYLDEAIERALAHEREILAPRGERTPRPQISLAKALVKLPIKSLGAVENRFLEVRREKRLKDQFKRKFLHWLRTTKPHLESHDPQEHVQRFAKTFKGPMRKAREEGYREGRRIAREEQEASRTKLAGRDGKTMD